MDRDWMNEFDLDPEGTLAELFTGRQRIPGRFSVDIGVALYYEFLLASEDRLHKLDKALRWWARLSMMLWRHLTREDVLGLSSYSYRMEQMLVLMYMLKLPLCLEEIHTHFDVYKRELETPNRESGRPLLLELDTVIDKYKQKEVK